MLEIAHYQKLNKILPVFNAFAARNLHLKASFLKHPRAR